MAEDEFLEGLDKDIYNFEEREENIDNDEISPEEDCFMQGYDEADK